MALRAVHCGAAGWRWAGKNLYRQLVKERGGPAVENRLEESRNEWAVAKQLVEKGQEIGIKRQTVKGVIVGDLAVDNSLGPFIVEMHVPGIRQEKRRACQAQED